MISPNNAVHVEKLKDRYEDGVVIPHAFGCFRHDFEMRYPYNVDDDKTIKFHIDGKESLKENSSATMDFEELRDLVKELAHLVLGISFDMNLASKN